MVTQDVNNVKQRAQFSFRNNFWVNKHSLVPYAFVTRNSDTNFVLEWRNWQLFWLWNSCEEAEGWQISGQGVCRVPETEVSGTWLWSEIKYRGGEITQRRSDVNTRQNTEVQNYQLQYCCLWRYWYYVSHVHVMSYDLMLQMSDWGALWKSLN